MRRARKNKIMTGLPDTYGRGRIVGDYRRVALYGVDFLIEEKKKDLAHCGNGTMTEKVIRLREELDFTIRHFIVKWSISSCASSSVSFPASISL